MSNYLNEGDLDQVKGLLHYLNSSSTPSHGGLVADVTLTDSNGEAAGTITYEASEPGAGYVLRMPS